MASQTWCTPSHWSRSAPVAASTTSQRCSNLMSRMAAPIRARTTLLAPSQPSTNSAYTSCSDLSVRSTNATRIRPSLFFDLCDFDVATEFGVRVALQIGAQQRLEFRLVEHIGLGEPMRT